MAGRRIYLWYIRPRVVRAWVAALLAVGLTLLLRGTVIKTTAPLAESVSGKTILIDPGHGGPDPGCVVGAAVEEQIVLAIAKRLQVQFDRAFVHTRLTREANVDLADADLTDLRARKRQDIVRRAEMARSAHADLVVSVHANSFPMPVLSGAQTFYFPKQEAARRLAAEVQDSLVARLGPNVRREKEGDFLLLAKSPVPAIIVEVGFLSNPRESALLLTPEYQDQVAEAIGNGVVQYLARSAAGKTRLAPALNNHTRGDTVAKEWAARWTAVRGRQPDEVVLYFRGPTNRDDYLVPELRRISGFASLEPSERIRRALIELTAGPGPRSILVRALPQGAEIGQVSVVGKDVTVALDESGPFTGLGGRAREQAVFALVNTVNEIVPAARVHLVARGPRSLLDEPLAMDDPLMARPDLACPGRD